MTLEEIQKEIEKATYKTTAHELLADLFECSALSISNSVVPNEKREKQYMSVIAKYSDDVDSFVKIAGMIFDLLTTQLEENRINDWLGELYMKSETSNKKAGQFFTPYHVSKLNAALNIDAATVNKELERDGIITVIEPTCGSGGLVVACVDVLYNRFNVNYARNLFVEAGDIDRRCVHMAYIQLSLLGVPAVVKHRDGLTNTTWETFVTPACALQYDRFKSVLKGERSE